MELIREIDIIENELFYIEISQIDDWNETELEKDSAEFWNETELEKDLAELHLELTARHIHTTSNLQPLAVPSINVYPK